MIRIGEVMRNSLVRGPASVGALALAVLGLGLPLQAEEIDLNSSAADIEVTASASGVKLTQSNQALAKGDLDHDGEIDLVIGAGGAASATETGKVYVLFGPLTAASIDLASTDPDIEVTGGPSGGMLGYAVAVGDVTNDGNDDLIVSAPKADGPSSRTDSGAVYVFFGPLSAGTLTISSGAADLTIWGDDAGDQLGHGLAIGNIAGSTAADLGIGAPYADGYNNAEVDGGEVVFLNGPLSSGTWDLDSTTASEIFWGNLGTRLHQVAVGELTGDAYNDVVTGAPGDGSTKGSVFVQYGPITSGAQINYGHLTPYSWGTGRNSTYGSDLVIGDFNHDGQDDLVSLAKVFDGGNDYGVVYGFLGPLGSGVNDDPEDVYDMRIQFPDFANGTGDATSLAFGDVSNDGVSDLLIGAIAGSGPDNNRTNAGQVHVFYGPVDPRDYDLNTEISQVVVYGASGAYAGYDVIDADMNGDDTGDLVVAAPVQTTVSGSAGKVHILSGSRCFFDAFNDGTLQSAWTLSELGSADQGVATEASGVLDLEGDGTGISGTSDDAVFLYRNDVTGDFRVEATIAAVPGNTGGAFRRGGLWLRSDEAPPTGKTLAQAPGVSVTYLPRSTTPNIGEIRFRMRREWGGSGDDAIGSTITQSSGTNTFNLPVRVAIERIGGMYCVYYFKNEGNPRWVKPAGGQGGCTKSVPDGGLGHPTLGDQPQIGLMTGANDASTTATFRYDEFSVCRP